MDLERGSEAASPILHSGLHAFVVYLGTQTLSTRYGTATAATLHPSHAGPRAPLLPPPTQVVQAQQVDQKCCLFVSMDPATYSIVIW